MDKYKNEAAGVFAPDAAPAADPSVPVESTGWSVVVAIPPTGRQDDAQRMLGTIQAAGLPEAYLALRNGRPVIAYGRYDDPGSPEAQGGLARVRSAQVSGTTPFASAMLTPPSARVGTVAGNADYDLRNVKKRRPEALYTLQIGVYGRGDFQKPTPEELALFRREAEKAVAQLRAEGDEAYFYHGPHNSSVTIGVFTEDDHDGSTTPPVESARLRTLRERYPNNLLNGEGLMETIRTDTGPVKRLQASRLVAVPQK